MKKKLIVLAGIALNSWNVDNLSLDTVMPDFRPRDAAYVKAIIEAVKDKPEPIFTACC